MHQVTFTLETLQQIQYYAHRAQPRPVLSGLGRSRNQAAVRRPAEPAKATSGV